MRLLVSPSTDIEIYIDIGTDIDVSPPSLADNHTLSFHLIVDLSLFSSFQHLLERLSNRWQRIKIAALSPKIILTFLFWEQDVCLQCYQMRSFLLLDDKHQERQPVL